MPLVGLGGHHPSLGQGHRLVSLEDLLNQTVLPHPNDSVKAPTIQPEQAQAAHTLHYPTDTSH